MINRCVVLIIIHISEFLFEDQELIIDDIEDSSARLLHGIIIHKWKGHWNSKCDITTDKLLDRCEGLRLVYIQNLRHKDYPEIQEAKKECSLRMGKVLWECKSIAHHLEATSCNWHTEHVKGVGTGKETYLEEGIFDIVPCSNIELDVTNNEEYLQKCNKDSLKDEVCLLFFRYLCLLYIRLNERIVSYLVDINSKNELFVLMSIFF